MYFSTHSTISSELTAANSTHKLHPTHYHNYRSESAKLEIFTSSPSSTKYPLWWTSNEASTHTRYREYDHVSSIPTKGCYYITAPIITLICDNPHASELLNHNGSNAWRFCHICRVYRQIIHLCIIILKLQLCVRLSMGGQWMTSWNKRLYLWTLTDRS